MRSTECRSNVYFLFHGVIVRGVDIGEGFGGPDPTLKICWRVRVCFTPKMTHSFIQNCWITLQVSHHEGWGDLCQKRKVNLIFEAPETGWWLDLTVLDPLILRHIYTTGHCACSVHLQCVPLLPFLCHASPRRSQSICSYQNCPRVAHVFQIILTTSQRPSVYCSTFQQMIDSALCPCRGHATTHVNHSIIFISCFLVCRRREQTATMIEGDWDVVVMKWTAAAAAAASCAERRNHAAVSLKEGSFYSPNLFRIWPNPRDLRNDSLLTVHGHLSLSAN